MDVSKVSLVDGNNSDLKNITNKLMHKYRIIPRSISSTDNSFERALSISLFGSEEEKVSITSALNTKYNSSFDCQWNVDESYIKSAAEIYGISIYIHTIHSVHVYEIQNEYPIIHLIKLKWQNESYIYLGTEKNSIINNNEKDEMKSIQLDDIDLSNTCTSNSKSNNLLRFESRYSLNLMIRQIESDGNCFFRSLCDQLIGSQDGHIILRKLITDFLSDNRETFEIYIDREYFSSWNEFIYQMGRAGTYADAIVILASAMFFREYIIIHQKNQRPIIYKPLSGIKNINQIHLDYSSKALHFNSMWSADGSKLHIDEIESFFV